MTDSDDDEDVVVLHTIKDVREQLLLKGVPPERLARALLNEPPTMIEHEEIKATAERSNPKATED
jgi:hypothetical protein